MKAILDTHAFLWFTTDDPRLSETAREFISDGRNEVYLSAATAWEIAIKAGRGRLTLPESPEKYVASRMAAYRLQGLPVLVSHALSVFELPEIHRDPFDRLLIVQSRMEAMPLVTFDDEIRKYDVLVIW
jgi:PIN domain nuclease of toxin-antitoxin system